MEDALSTSLGRAEDVNGLLEFDKIDGTLLEETCWWLNSWFMNWLGGL